MAIGIFGGSFDPVHKEHVRYALSAAQQLHLRKLFIMPSYIAPHKRQGAAVSAEHRLAMCRIAVAEYDCIEVSDYEISQKGASYTYLTCRHFKALFPDEELYFLVGADMLENFFTWKNPQEILSYATLAVCGRGNEQTQQAEERLYEVYGKRAVRVDFTGKDVSSTRIRTQLAFGKQPPDLDGRVFEYIVENQLYTHPAIAPALALEKESRREHSYRVALMAVKRARSLGIPEQKALLAAALHDCAKYVPLHSPLLKGCFLEEGVPAPVVHQYTGAYLAEHHFGIDEEDVLLAIRYHTSGRENMTELEKLIYLADLLESSREFDGVEELRKVFWEDIDRCLYLSLKNQVSYLRSSGKPVYRLTEDAFRWAQEKQTKVEEL